MYILLAGGTGAWSPHKSKAAFLASATFDLLDNQAGESTAKKLKQSCRKARKAAMKGMKRQVDGAARNIPNIWVNSIPRTIPS